MHLVVRLSSKSFTSKTNYSVALLSVRPLLVAAYYIIRILSYEHGVSQPRWHSTVTFPIWHFEPLPRGITDVRPLDPFIAGSWSRRWTHLIPRLVWAASYIVIISWLNICIINSPPTFCCCFRILCITCIYCSLPIRLVVRLRHYSTKPQ